MTDLNLSDLDGLADFDSLEIPETDSGVPDGRYQVFVEQVELGRSQSNNRRLKWQFRIIGPSHAGRCLFTGHNLETADNLRWLKKDLVICGVKMAKWSELESRLGDLLDIVLEVQVRTKGDYQNVYLNKRIVLADGVHPRDLIGHQGNATQPTSAAAALFHDNDPPF